MTPLVRIAALGVVLLSVTAIPGRADDVDKDLINTARRRREDRQSRNLQYRRMPHQR